MSFLSKYITLILVLTYSYSCYAGEKQPLIKALDKRRDILENRAYNEVNPEKRKKYLQQLYATESYYLREEAKLEMVRQNYPEFAKQVEYYKALPEEIKNKKLDDSIAFQRSRSSFVIENFESSWNNLTDIQKAQVCGDSVEMCFDNEELTKCKFVLIRCKFIINDEIYKRVKSFAKETAIEKAQTASKK